MNRGPDGRFCGNRLRAWLPIFLDESYWNPLIVMLEIASHWCYTETARQYRRAADLVLTDAHPSSERCLTEAQKWIARREVLQKAMGKLRAI